MSRRSKQPGGEVVPESPCTKGDASIQMGGRLLLVLIGVLQVLAIVQSDSSTDALFHGSFLLALIVFCATSLKR
jgi:hypothetical protein